MLHFIHFLQNLPPESIEIIGLVAAWIALLAFLRFFGQIGLACYMSIAVIIANIEVLKMAEFSFLSHPIALGTPLFSTTFLCSCLLAEFYGKKAAQKAVWLSVASSCITTFWLTLTIGIDPHLPPLDYDGYTTHHHAMETLFIQSPAIFLAGTIAYVCSQLYDIWLFNRLKVLFQSRLLWLRNGLAMAIASFVDSALFSVLAFMVLHPHPIPFKTIWKGYILGTYGIRLLLTLFNAPIILLARKWPPKDTSTASTQVQS